MEKDTDASQQRMTMILRGSSASDPRIGSHGVPAFLSGQQNIGRDACFSVISSPSVHGVA
jgi:hypothetical protein